MQIVRAEVITIGDEILIGQITDTNTQFISEKLNNIGIKVVRKSSVGDEEQEILTILKEAASRADIIITTGGLGPTKDDITKHTICKFFNTGLVQDKATLEHVRAFFEKRGREFSEINQQQAMVPENAEVLFNQWGTAPGMWIEHEGKVFISLAGVPFEMRTLITDQVIPKLLQRFQMPTIVHKNILTIGLGESFLAEKIADWEDQLPEHIKLAYLPSLGAVRLRLTGISDNKELLIEEIEKLTQKVLPTIQQYVYGFGETKLEEAIGTLLKERKYTIATAESCSGGYAAHLLTSISGSSAYYKGSIVAYANDIKINQLGVAPEILNQFGAVSEQTVIAMAEGVRKKLGTDIGIASSGIAGPDGGTADKPVGTIWIAYADKDKTIARLLQLGSTRENNIRITALSMLNLVRKNISE